MLWSTPRAIRMSGTIETWNLKDNSRHAPSWKTFEDEVMPAELDQEVMHWLQNHVQPHDSMSAKELVYCTRVLISIHSCERQYGLYTTDSN